MDVRPYATADRSACLAVFDSLFPAGQRAEYEKFLDDPGPYAVMEHAGAIVGCGGYAAPDADGVGRLVWGMVHREWQRQGLGRFLLMYRMREISKAGRTQMVALATSPAAQGFYEKQGFRVAGVERERVAMVRKMAVCA